MSYYGSRSRSRWSRSYSSPRSSAPGVIHKRKYFESCSAFLGEISKPESREFRTMQDKKSWTGESIAESLSFLQNGNASLVPEAEKMLEKLIAEIPVSRVDWQNDICGCMPDVPAFLSGVPENMRARVVRQTETAPIKIYVNLASSVSVDYKLLIKRGIALLALVLQLQKFRQVEVYTYCDLDGYVTIIKQQTSPIQLSEICYTLTSQGFTRGLCYAMSESLAGRYLPGRCLDVSEERGVCGAAEKDLVLGMCQWNSPIIEDPVKWINDTIATYIKEVDA